MFQRNSHKLPPDLLTNFQKSFPRTGWPTFCDTQNLPPSPERTLSQDTEPAMNFNPNYGNQEEATDQVSSPGTIGDWAAHSDPFNNPSSEFFSLFHDMTTTFQHTPASSSYGHQQHFFPGPPQFQDQPPGMPTPQSASGLSSAAFFGHGPFMNNPNQQMQAMQQPLGPGPNYLPFPQHAAQPAPHLNYHQGSAYITPDRLALPSKNALETPPCHEETGEGLRFRVTLMTGTAMVREDELPVTYLNKCQPYKMIVKDTRPEHYTYGPTTYRTFIRVSFNEQQQRDRAAHCWQLWKDGRGLTEAQQRGTKPFAVEYVAQNMSQQSSNIVVQNEVFDGFCFHWTSSSTRNPECEIQLRCNFLSTDFSHSKGVKGIPVRLCAKTEVLQTSQPEPAHLPEVCYCKVKLFRDHGAERKLANDEQHVRKSILKLEEQMRQVQANQEEPVMTSSGKRRQSDSYGMTGRPNKIAKLKRAPSASTEASSPGFKEGSDGDIQAKLAVFNDTLRSKREVSILFLKGDAEDDPDEYPVELPTSAEPLSESPVDRNLSRRNTQFTAASSGSPTAPATNIGPLSRGRPGSVTKIPTSDWKSSTKLESDSEPPSSTVKHPANPRDKTPRTETRMKLQPGLFEESIEVSDVDPSYVPPHEQKPRAVACFYVRYSVNGEPPSEPYYRAIYLRERSLAGFMQAISLKRNISPDNVSEIIMRRELGISSAETGNVLIQVDDDVVTDILEGQDMLADFSPTFDDQGSSRNTKDLRYRLTIQFDEPPRAQR